MATLVQSSPGLKAGDAVWIALAFLHQRYPKRLSFQVPEIVQEVKKTGLWLGKESTVYEHAHLHCVANPPPNEAKLKMIVKTEDGGRRLFRPGDTFHPLRSGRTTPKRANLPVHLLPLLDWYREWSNAQRVASTSTDPLLALRGSGRALWADEHADDYINNLREEWR